MTRNALFSASVTAAVCLLGTWLTYAATPQAGAEQERSVKQSEVPAAALAALKKLAGGASFTEFAEETENGHKFYEGSWSGPDGNVDALVTETGDIVEIEEALAGDKIPAAVRAAAEKAAGKDANTTFERKTLYLYELKFQKDGKGHEMLLTADAQPYHEHAQGTPKGDGDGDSDDDEREEK